MHVLYLAPLIPAVSGNGGKRAIYNHLEDVARLATVDLIVVDVENSGDTLPAAFTAFRSRVFPRAMPRGGSVGGALAALRQWLFDEKPRAAAVIASTFARSAVRDALAASKIDVIVVDHLNAWSLIQGIETTVPIYYVAHNVESDVLRDQMAQCGRISPRRVRLAIELAKMRRYEADLLHHASTVIAIAATDCDSDPLQAVREKVVIWPELPDVKVDDWRAPGTRTLLFVGSAAYFPNRDAIEWLVAKFMPEMNRLAPDVVLRIAGTSRADVAQLPASPSVVFEGFVPSARLDELHRTSDLFVCPVVLGSGIKIKVLEATSYGLPIAATMESLRGIDYLSDAALQIDRDPEAAARSVVALLDDSKRLQAASARSTQQLLHARATRPPFLQNVHMLWEI